MPFFRKKPVVIEAHQVKSKVTNDGMFRTETFNFHLMPEEFKQAVCFQDHSPNARRPPLGFTELAGTGKPHIDTLEGPMEVSDGDWIIKGVKGEFYPCKPDIFDLTYEETSPPRVTVIG